MMLAIPLAALLAVAAAPEPAGDAMAATVAPFLGEEVGAVVRLDLARWDTRGFARGVLGKLADEPGVAPAVAAAEDRVGALKAAGAKELFVLIDPADLPGVPVVMIPLAGGADAKALAAALAAASWPASETIRGALVAGTPAALARVRAAEPAPRPELAAALGAGGDAAVRVAVIPSAVQRRALEEGMGELPPELGGGPIAAVTRGLSWASLALEAGPRPALRVVLRGADEAAAKTLRDLLQRGLGLAAKAGGADPTLAPIAQAVGRLTPKAEGDRVTLEANLADMAGLMAAPVRQVNEAARRTRCMNNLKQIGLAMHNWHSGHDAFPPAYSVDKQGKPLLSWRVQILPFLDEQKLYDEFHHDEPWDSPHNKVLIARMPQVYACPDEAPTLIREGKTTYLTPRGPHTVFPGADGVKIQAITDGTSNTVFVVDASDAMAVSWTRPDDWEVGDGPKFDGLSGHHPGGANVLFADGSVRFLKETLAPKVLKALLTRDGGEVIGSEEY